MMACHANRNEREGKTLRKPAHHASSTKKKKKKQERRKNKKGPKQWTERGKHERRREGRGTYPGRKEHEPNKGGTTKLKTTQNRRPANRIMATKAEDTTQPTSGAATMLGSERIYCVGVRAKI